MFDARRVWTVYSGQRWPENEKARAISDARKFYGGRSDLYPGGVRLIDEADRVLWSIGAVPTFRLEIDWGDGEGWRELWGAWGLSKWEAEHGRNHNAEFLGKPVRIVPEDYPRESTPVESVQLITFSSPEVQPASPQAGRPVAPVIFQFGEESAA
ncbi:hypothetical protein [Streptomyces sp. WAC 06738]|uniref:hypothetical protein n=1 Tax=Streptomyces sp. WAC 06738 TaxID=2203210 RepID=UPI000F76B4A7|nr:hypothetical protein [Streptomyces sp. WAC 06738]